MAQRKKIRQGSGYLAAGTAVAAVLLAVNIGAGYLLLSSRTEPETAQVAMSDQIADQDAQQRYVGLMQEYYTQKTGTPCDFDFTGYGIDLDETIETEDARFHITGIAGCDWVMYYFFDVEPLDTENLEYYASQDFDHLGDNLLLLLHPCDAEGKKVDCIVQNRVGPLPAQKRLEDGVFHCYGMLINTGAQPFSTSGYTLRFSEHSPAAEAAPDFSIPLNFLKQIPLTENNLPADFTAGLPMDEPRNGYSPREMTRCAVTPFGIYYVSDTYSHSEGTGGSWYSLDDPTVFVDFVSKIIQTDADGAEVDSFLLDPNTCFGSHYSYGEGANYAILLFDHPYDAAKGALTRLSTFQDDFLEGEDVCTETGDGPVEIFASTHSDDPDGRVIWKNNDGDTTITFQYEIDLSKADQAQWLAFNAMEAADAVDPMPLEFSYELTAADGDPVGTAYTPISGFAVRLEPADEPYLMTVHIQPVGGDGYGLALEQFILNNQITVSETEDGDPTQEFTFSTNVFKDPDFKYDGAYTTSYGIYDTADDTKPGLETIKYSESENLLYLCTQLTGHDTAEGETYNLFVKAYQDTEDGTEPVLLSLTPDGEKQDGVWISDLPQGDFNHIFTSLYTALRTDSVESKITFELWYQPDVIQPEMNHFTDLNGGFQFFAHHYIALDAEYTAE